MIPPCKLLYIKPSEKDSISISGLLTKNDLNFRLLDEENISQDALITENQGLSLNWSGIKSWQMASCPEGGIIPITTVTIAIGFLKNKTYKRKVFEETR